MGIQITGYWKIQIWCLTKAHIELITLLTIIYVGHGCEGYRSNSFIHAEYEVTSTIGTTVQNNFFVTFYAQYQNITRYGVWLKPLLETLTDEE